MNNKTKLLSLLFFAIMSVLVNPVSTFQQNKLDEILAKIEKNYDTTEGLFCRYEQTETISQLTDEIHLAGKLYFRKPHFIMMEMRGDENLNLYVNGEKIWIEDLDLDELEVIDFQHLGKNNRISKLIPPFFLNSIEELKKHFDITLIQSEKGPNRLELIPKPESGFNFISLQFDIDRYGRIPWMKVIYDERNSKEIWFRDWEKIPKISKYFFQYRSGKQEIK
jgi:outer membrane lipoprotein-sorting protein